MADINENGTDGVLLPVFLPESDFNQQNVQIIKVTNDPLFTNTFNDPDIFVLVEDELHWLNGNAFVKLVKFSNMKRNNEIENINGNSSNSKLMPIQVQVREKCTTAHVNEFYRPYLLCCRPADGKIKSFL